MSGIFIPGLEMPNKCMDCPCSGTYTDGLWGCEIKAELLTSTELEDGKPEHCPLVPVPGHGDLIDRDALRKAVIVDNYISWTNAKAAIDLAPTIIPADKGGA